MGYTGSPDGKISKVYAQIELDEKIETVMANQVLELAPLPVTATPQEQAGYLLADNDINTALVYINRVPIDDIKAVNELPSIHTASSRKILDRRPKDNVGYQDFGHLKQINSDLRTVNWAVIEQFLVFDPPLPSLEEIVGE